MELIQRPTAKGIYAMSIELKQGMPLRRVQDLLKQIGSAASTDGSNSIGLWRCNQPDGRFFYQILPKEEEQKAGLYQFEAGAAVAFIPPENIRSGQTSVQWIYTSLLVPDDLPNPPGWNPQKTIVGSNGIPISETNRTGQTVDLFRQISGGSLPQLPTQADWSNVPAETIQAVAPAVAAAWIAAKPILTWSAKQIATLAILYLSARYLLQYATRILFHYGGKAAALLEKMDPLTLLLIAGGLIAGGVYLFS